jgi:hypothetical protein
VRFHSAAGTSGKSGKACAFAASCSAGLTKKDRQTLVFPPSLCIMPLGPRRTAAHRGVLILVLGILSLVFCGLFTGIPAWIMGNNDLKEIRAGAVDREGESLTNIGRILGMVGTILNILFLCGYGILFAIGGAAVMQGK